MAWASKGTHDDAKGVTEILGRVGGGQNKGSWGTKFIFSFNRFKGKLAH